jgi:hypothetical protein
MTPKQTKKTGTKNLRNTNMYFDFILWISLPKTLRKPKTQRELAKKFGVGEDTLSDWKNRVGFWDEVSKQRKSWCKEKTSDVIEALYQKIIETGGASEVRLWFEMVEDWSTKEEVKNVRVIPEDIANMTDAELQAESKRLRAFFTKKSDNK